MMFTTFLNMLPLLAFASASPVSPRQKGNSGSIPTGTVYADPPGNVHRLHPWGRNDLCLGVSGGYAGDGTALGLILCRPTDDTTYGNIQLWDLGDSDTSEVRLSGTDWCIDAGSPPTSGSRGVLRKCNGQSSQAIYHAADHLVFTGINQCLGVDPDSSAGLHPPYATYRNFEAEACTAGNNDQTITIYDGPDE